jgi:hypothetical protein
MPHSNEKFEINEFLVLRHRQNRTHTQAPHTVQSKMKPSSHAQPDIFENLFGVVILILG